MRAYLIILILFISCNEQKTETDTNQLKINNDTLSNQHASNTLILSRTNLYVWHVDYENKTKTKNPQFQDQYLNVDTIIKGLNERNPKIQLDKIRISGDTLFTVIKDSYYLGESIGSYGASAYIAEAVINLTSVNNINYVQIDFEDGSHISPGVWSKKQFKNYVVSQ